MPYTTPVGKKKIGKRKKEKKKRKGEANPTLAII
jgi:hypothetical protein